MGPSSAHHLIVEVSTRGVSWWPESCFFRRFGAEIGFGSDWISGFGEKIVYLLISPINRIIHSFKIYISFQNAHFVPATLLPEQQCLKAHTIRWLLHSWRLQSDIRDPLTLAASSPIQELLRSTLSSLLLIIILQNRYYYCTHFEDGKTEAGVGWVTWLRSSTGKE